MAAHPAEDGFPRSETFGPSRAGGNQRAEPPIRQIPNLIGLGGATDCFRCDGGAPCRRWIPTFGDLCTTVLPAQAGINVQSPGTPDSQPDRAGAARRTASGVMAAHPAEDGFPRSETFEQTVIPAQAGIHVQSPGTPDSQPDRAGAARRTASGVMAAHPAEDRFPRSETFAQPSFPRRRESRFGGSPVGMLAISATLSPTGGVTQRSTFAGMTEVGGNAPLLFWWSGTLNDTSFTRRSLPTRRRPEAGVPGRAPP